MPFLQTPDDYESDLTDVLASDELFRPISNECGSSSLAPSAPSPQIHDVMSTVHPLPVNLAGPTKTSKRKRGIEVLFSSEIGDGDHDQGTKRRRTRLAIIRVPRMRFPKSMYYGWRPPLDESKEASVLSDFKARRWSSPIAPYGESELYELQDFCVYGAFGRKAGQFVSLHSLDGNKHSFFDGILSNGTLLRYVQRVPFRLVSIGNYADVTRHHVKDEIWIQSIYNERKEIWYKLMQPAAEYEHYHVEFLWLANFAKYFIDFLGHHQDVVLHDFRAKFHEWLLDLHTGDGVFEEWLTQFSHTDFCSVVCANTEFLWKEATDINANFTRYPLWSEFDLKSLTAVKEHETTKKTNTAVTPWIYECFEYMSWGKHLDSISLPPISIERKSRHERALGFIPKSYAHAMAGRGHTSSYDNAAVYAAQSLQQDNEGKVPRQPQKIRVGEVVGVLKDDDTVWKGTAELWFAYVQHIQRSNKGKQLLHVIWLYAPSDTTCSTMRYPIKDELFLSDHCNCEDVKLEVSEIVCTIPVNFRGEPGVPNAKYFVRQKYTHDVHEAKFVTLQEADFRCEHHTTELPKPYDAAEQYHVGDTVLVLDGDLGGVGKLEPAEIVDLRPNRYRRMILMRRLLRRHRDFGDSSARPNELVYTNDLFLAQDKDIFRLCQVRFYTTEDKEAKRIPTPYNRDGTGDCYYFTHHQIREGLATRLEPLVIAPHSLNQGFDPLASSTRPKLHGLDLFCGGGNFGRGIEEGGAVHYDWAVDLNKHAIYSYKANLTDPTKTELYFGSVNEFLSQGIQGHTSKHIPGPGEVDFISAGSPCQGFSNANQDKNSENSLRNCSLVASVAAFIDFYRPKYALLENVMGMSKRGSKEREENVFSQLLCALVGMGYQTQQFNIDAWCFGSSQSRSRLFISIAAPGLALPLYPAPSHSHPPTKRNSCVGVAANGIKFGVRRFQPTPFQYVTAIDAINDLPLVGDSHIQNCIAFPDHRTSRFEDEVRRMLIKHIPVYPQGQGFVDACRRRYMPKPQREDFRWENKQKIREGSRSWMRIKPNGLLPTITTAAHPSCAFTGQILHPYEHRVITVMEARRAQGFPDHEVIIGSPREQWRIIGNSVDRRCALALGLSLRDAWLSNKPALLLDGDTGTIRVLDEKKVSVKSPLSLQSVTRLSGPIEVRKYKALDSSVLHKKPEPEIIVISDDEADPLGNGHSASSTSILISSREASPLASSYRPISVTTNGEGPPSQKYPNMIEMAHRLRLQASNVRRRPPDMSEARYLLGTKGLAHDTTMIPLRERLSLIRKQQQPQRSALFPVDMGGMLRQKPIDIMD
ncbi:MAG: DNA methyltransferase Dim-2 [Pycnora praestabilis]|nr:MAG: DNA methyltransferase Dim-2 [Pycnora praestabilis]